MEAVHCWTARVRADCRVFQTPSPPALPSWVSSVVHSIIVTSTWHQTWFRSGHSMYRSFAAVPTAFHRLRTGVQPGRSVHTAGFEPPVLGSSSVACRHCPSPSRTSTNHPGSCLARVGLRAVGSPPPGLPRNGPVRFGDPPDPVLGLGLLLRLPGCALLCLMSSWCWPCAELVLGWFCLAVGPSSSGLRQTGCVARGSFGAGLPRGTAGRSVTCWFSWTAAWIVAPLSVSGLGWLSRRSADAASSLAASTALSWSSLAAARSICWWIGWLRTVPVPAWSQTSFSFHTFCTMSPWPKGGR
jgi:hypothetical protein